MAGQHGFARTLSWTISVSEALDSAICRLTHSERTLELWPYRFELEYHVGFENGSLKTELKVLNKDEAEFCFTSLLHTYFKVQDLASVRVHGLNGVTFADKLFNGKTFREDRDLVTLSQEVDRNYLDFPGEVTLTHAAGKLRLVGNGFIDLVIWNPWIDKSKAMADFGDEEYKEMICLEAGKIASPVKLSPGQCWTGNQLISVIKSQN